MRDLGYVKSMFSNKSIALIGNSQSLLDSRNHNYGARIDSYDIVCRINSGYILNATKQGSKTDILFAAVPLSLEDIDKKFNPSLILWTTPKGECPEYISKHPDSFKCPVDVWEKLFKVLGKRPSSGIIALNFLAVFLNLHVDIFGFDFFNTTTYYNRKDLRARHPHSGKAEKEFTHELQRESKINIYTS